MSDLFGNHIVDFPTRRLKSLLNIQVFELFIHMMRIALMHKAVELERKKNPFISDKQCNCKTTLKGKS